jgi:thiol-disulfide isomerase/thioredoxin
MKGSWKIFIFLLMVLPASSKDVAKTAPQKWERIRHSDPPEFSLQDSSGKKISLSSFRGKFVIISMTASWCGPCKQEIPATREMQQEFPSNDIVWIFISFDKDIPSWKESIRADNLKGIHLWGKPESGSLKTLFDFNSIPYYIWIDEEGNVAVNDAPRPSSRTAGKQLKYYLK